MISLWADVTAEDGQLMAGTIDAVARALHADRAPDDDRTLEQFRVDVLRDLVLGDEPGARSAVDLPAGSGDLPEGPAVVADHNDPAAVDDVDREAGTGGLSTDVVSATTPVRPDEEARPVREPKLRGRRPQVNVTVSWSTLIGRDDAPADLTGYGPIDATTARRIAADPSAVWRRLIVDPVSGTLLDRGRTTYRPPRDLTDFVITRDACCRFPTCDRPAVVCDIDHRDEYRPYAPAGGSTSADNLDAACENHHKAKHEGGFTHLRDVSSHDSIWLSPRGRTVRKAATVLPHATAVDPPPF